MSSDADSVEGIGFYSTIDSGHAPVGAIPGDRRLDTPDCGAPYAKFRILLVMLLSAATLLTGPRQASAQEVTTLFDTGANYSVPAGYGNTTVVDLSGFLASGVTGVTFTLASCDSARGDYYDSVVVENSQVELQPNTQGHVHGSSTGTQTATICTVTASRISGMDTETQDQAFQFYITPNRTPPGLSFDDVVLEEARTDEVDIKITGNLGTDKVRVQWRKSGGSIVTRIAQGVSNSTVLTIPGLDANTGYEIRVALMSSQSFDLYRGNNTTSGTLISPISPANKWVQNVGSSAFGKSATLNVTTSDLPALSIDDVTVEEGQDAVFTVTLSNPASTTVTVSYATAATGSNPATAGTDYTAHGVTTLSFTAGDRTKTVTVLTTDDDIAEDAETFKVTLSNPSGATVSDDEGLGTITDNDGTPALSIDDVTVEEGQDAVFTVTLSNPASTTVTVSYATAATGSNPATAGTDYTAHGVTTLSFTAGDRTKTVTVLTTDDDIAEDAETFKVTLSNPSGATVSDDEGLGTITDNDGTPALSIDDVTVEEGQDAVFTVTLSNPASTTVTVSYATAATGSNPATAGTDYTAHGVTTLSFTAGDRTKTVTVLTTDDDIAEDAETFKVTLSNPSGATVSDDEGLGTITDNDGTPALSIDDVTVEEGQDAVFTVTLSNPASTTVTVSYATAATGSNPATAGTDYTAHGVTTLSFTAGDRTKTVTVLTTDDDIAEDAETFKVTLSNPSGATVSDDEGLGTITDNDGTPALSIDDVTVEEGQDAVFTVTLSNPASTTVTVSYATAATGSNPATAGTDYTAHGVTTLSFTAGDRTKTVTVLTTDDDIAEDAETFKVTLSNPSGATVSDDEGLGTITDNDGTPALSIDDVTVEEGQDAVFTVTLSNPASTTVTVSYATAATGSNPATAGTDYTAHGVTTLSFTAGDRTKTVTVLTTDDDIAEDAETFKVTLSNPSGATVSDDEGLGTITDNDGTPALSIDDVTVEEGQDAVFTVTLSVTSMQEVRVAYATSDGTAEEPSDYTATDGTLTFAPGETEKTIPVAVIDDALDEPDETFTVVLSNPENAVFENNEATGTITERRVPPRPTVRNPTVIIDDITVSETVGTASFTVSLGAPSPRVVTVNFRTVDGTAVTVLDYTATDGTLTFAPGETEKTIPVAVIDDALDEPDETFTVVLSNPDNAVLSAEEDEGTATIIDNDAPTLSIDDVTVDEGDEIAVFVVLLSVPSGRTVTVDYRTVDGTAVTVLDYTATDGTLTFAPGETEKTIPVAVIDDALDEPDETFTVVLSNPDNAVLSAEEDEGTATIIDNDAPTLSIDDVTVDEGDEIAVFVVLLSVPSGRTVTVDYRTVDGTAVTVLDYTATDGTLTFAPGETEKTIPVAVIDDALDEPDETFTVVLSNPDNAVLSAEEDEGTATIIDNDAPTLSIDDVTVDEGDEIAVFVVLLSVPSGRTVTVDYRTVDGTAVTVLDYTATDGTLTFAPGETEKTIPVAVIDDALDEPDETFTVVLSNPDNAVLSAEEDEGTATIIDNDAPTLSIDDVTVDEGDEIAVFVVLLSVPSGRTVTVDYRTVDGTAVTVLDYTATDGTLTFAPGETEKTIPVAVIDDALDEPDETFTVVLSNPDNAVLSAEEDEGTATIIDNDAPTLSIDDVTVDEGDEIAVFVVLLSVPSGRTVTVDYRTVDGTAVTVLDYTATDGTLTFAPGETEKTIPVAVIDDALDEPDETFTVVLSNPDNAVLSAEEDEGTATIIDNDAPTLSIDDVTVDEGDEIAVFVVLLSVPSERTVTVDYRTVDGTAVTVSDYTATDGTLTFGPGETEKTIPVAVIDDALDEPDETFTVTLSVLRNATLADGEGVGNITDDDYPAVTVSYGMVSYTVPEGDFIEVTVVLSAPPERSVVIPLTHMPGGGAIEADYSGIPESVTFKPVRDATGLQCHGRGGYGVR